MTIGFSRHIYSTFFTLIPIVFTVDAHKYHFLIFAFVAVVCFHGLDLRLIYRLRFVFHDHSLT
jgi:hypothetical protein